MNATKRQKRYKTAEGDYLTVDYDNYSHAYNIGWFLKEDQEVGSLLGENLENDSREDWEDRVATLAVQPLSEYRASNQGAFCFETETAAKRALNVANAALFAGEKPWPEWAILAKAAGWKPPEGWKP